jgi:hypothetical protein
VRDRVQDAALLLFSYLIPKLDHSVLVSHHVL